MNVDDSKQPTEKEISDANFEVLGKVCRKLNELHPIPIPKLNGAEIVKWHATRPIGASVVPPGFYAHIRFGAAYQSKNEDEAQQHNKKIEQFKESYENYKKGLFEAMPELEKEVIIKPYDNVQNGCRIINNHLYISVNSPVIQKILSVDINKQKEYTDATTMAKMGHFPTPSNSDSRSSSTAVQSVSAPGFSGQSQ